MRHFEGIGKNVVFDPIILPPLGFPKRKVHCLGTFSDETPFARDEIGRIVIGKFPVKGDRLSLSADAVATT